jgi:thiol-disulfide isomerase/thioredoxin
MLSRRAALLAGAAASSVFVTPAFTAETKPFTRDDFAAAQKAGKPIFVAIHATWCPTCKAQKPMLSELMAEPKFKNLVRSPVVVAHHKAGFLLFDRPRRRETAWRHASPLCRQATAMSAASLASCHLNTRKS